MIDIKSVSQVFHEGHIIRLGSTSDTPEIDNTFAVGRDIVKLCVTSSKVNIRTWFNAQLHANHNSLFLEGFGPGTKKIYWVSLKKLIENIRPLAHPKMRSFINLGMFKDPMQLLNLFTEDTKMYSEGREVTIMEELSNTTDKTQEGCSMVAANSEQVQEEMQLLHARNKELIEKTQYLQARNKELIEKINILYQEKAEMEHTYKELLPIPDEDMPLRVNAVEPVLTLNSLLEFMRTEKVQVTIKPL